MEEKTKKTHRTQRETRYKQTKTNRKSTKYGLKKCSFFKTEKNPPGIIHGSADPWIIPGGFLGFSKKLNFLIPYFMDFLVIFSKKWSTRWRHFEFQPVENIHIWHTCIINDTHSRAYYSRIRITLVRIRFIKWPWGAAALSTFCGSQCELDCWDMSDR